jgi:hypothetical protein
MRPFNLATLLLAFGISALIGLAVAVIISLTYGLGGLHLKKPLANAVTFHGCAPPLSTPGPIMKWYTCSMSSGGSEAVVIGTVDLPLTKKP